MKTLFRQITAAFFIIVAGQAQTLTVYQNNFDAGSSSLDDFTDFGNATSQVADGQAAIGVSGSNQGGISLNTTSLTGYSTILSANSGAVTWAFNLANQDGEFNNEFFIVLAGNISNPLDYGFPAQGYALEGGGLVGNRMLLTRFDQGLNSYQILIDVPSQSGLGTLPEAGAVRITYEPNNDTWSLYMDTSSTFTDPTSASEFLGSAVDGTYTDSELPFFSFGAETSGTDYFDNLSISVPEPSTLMVMSVGAISLLIYLRRHK